MAWTTPRTWVPQELVTAAQLNTHLRDNLDALRRPLYARGSRISTQTIADSTPTFINYTSDTDPYGLLDAATGILTIPQAGVWLFTGTASWGGNGTGIRSLSIAAGGEQVAFDARASAGAAVVTQQTVSAIFPASAGQQAWLSCSHTGGTSLAMQSARFAAVMLGEL